MDIIGIPNQQIIASGGLDAKICLWDLTTSKNIKILGTDNHDMKGVNNLDWY